MTTVPKLVPTYKVGTLEYASTLEQDLHIDRSNLSEEFSEHSSRYAWYSTAYELALDYENRLKTALERLYAKLDVEARTSFELNGVKATEKKIENHVLMHPDYVAVADAYNDAKLQTGLIKAARDAMIMKKDCLISLGANIRAEMASDPSLLIEQYKQKYQEKA